MVLQTQTIRRQIAFECYNHFVGLAFELLRPCQIPMTEHFCVHSQQLKLIIFAKSFILSV